MTAQMDSEMPDADVTAPPQPKSSSFLSEAELEEQFPNRPRNSNSTWPFHTLFERLFDPLLENRKRPAGAARPARAHVGPHGPFRRSPQEERKVIVERFIGQWRQEVGPDIYPAFRLIVPERDRDRAMYGLKEKTIGKILVKIMGLDRNSEDAVNLLNWKLPGQSAASRMAGDFGGRCYEIINKRPVRVDVGTMTIAEVNDRLDELSQAMREDAQIRIFTKFYNQMNPTELMWLIRIILRQMKIGATERTLFAYWHPDAEDLFSISSSLRRVCWDLYDPAIRLEPDDRGIALMQCFQPQLAQFRMNSFDKMVARLGPTEDDPEFWIEEKLDGERMQLHMITDGSVPGGRRFAFWSRKAKEYTYLYGNGLHDDNSALTRHLEGVFDDRVHNIILDGEMVTWDPELGAIVPFGTLKTAALDQQKNPSQVSNHRPVYKVFDILYLNDKALTSYTLRDRRKALAATVKSKKERLEIHPYSKATKVSEIEPVLRQVVESKAEGLVLKNPRSAYRLNERNDDWMKVKPEYMEEFGESLDCIVIGGYYGSGHRGGNLSSFLCGLIVKRKDIQKDENPQKCWSFFKVGGGFTAQDYANVRHQTEGKWIEWNKDRPPVDWIELGGGTLQYERPDVWIKPQDSIVLEVKAASVNDTDSFRTSKTLRFPRFKRIRSDRDWTTALTVNEFFELLHHVNDEIKDKQFKVDEERRKRIKRSKLDKSVNIMGGSSKGGAHEPTSPSDTRVFADETFYIIGESLQPERRTKAELENFVKAHGGSIRQTHDAVPNTICVADKRSVKVAALEKRGGVGIVRPAWLFDCVEQARIDAGKPKMLLPIEPNHVLLPTEKDLEAVSDSVDAYGDSYMRDIHKDELSRILEAMGISEDDPGNHRSVALLQSELEDYSGVPDLSQGWMFQGTNIFFDRGTESFGNDAGLQDVNKEIQQDAWTARFAGAVISENLEDPQTTHIVARNSSDERCQYLQQLVAAKSPRPRLVNTDWIPTSWETGRKLDEGRFPIF